MLFLPSWSNTGSLQRVQDSGASKEEKKSQEGGGWGKMGNPRMNFWKSEGG